MNFREMSGDKDSTPDSGDLDEKIKVARGVSNEAK